MFTLNLVQGTPQIGNNWKISAHAKCIFTHLFEIYLFHLVFYAKS